MLNRAYVVTGSACLRAFFSNSTNLLVPAGSYFGVLNLPFIADLASQKVSFDSPRHETYGGTNNSVFYICPKCSLFLYVFSHKYTCSSKICSDLAHKSLQDHSSFLIQDLGYVILQE